MRQVSNPAALTQVKKHCNLIEETNEIEFETTTAKLHLSFVVTNFDLHKK